MNQNNINNIQNAIEYLKEAKTNNSKQPIISAISCIDDVINNLNNDSMLVVDEVYLEKYNIKNDNTNAQETTRGINKLLIDAKEKGYNKLKLLPGTYAIDTSVVNPIILDDGGEWGWEHPRKGIAIPSDFELILKDCILKQIPCEDPYYSIVNFVHCKNSKITGGNIIGDKINHDYGMRLKDVGYLFKPGFINEETGLEEEIDTEDIITDYIDTYIDWFSKEKIKLPQEMSIVPISNTYFNSADGGKKRIYCYDENNNFLGITGNIALCDPFTLLEGTSKIRIRIFYENITKNDYTTNEYALTARTSYQTYEFGCGIIMCDSNNIEINGTVISNCIGDCICTFAPPLKLYTDNVKILNCDLHGSRRQGISLVSSGENYLIQGCKIHNIGGIDPQFGIDIEHYEYVKNVLIDDCDFYNNRKGDIDNYNGTENIEIKNCRFNGCVCSIYSPKKLVHDCIFEYHEGVNDDNKRDKGGASLNLTDHDIAYNNRFINSNLGGNALTYGNIVDGGHVNIDSLKDVTLERDKYYNATVHFNPRDSFDYYNNGYFENCEVREHNNNKTLMIENTIFENSTYWCSNTTTINNSVFNLKTVPLCMGCHVEHARWVLNDCIINADDYMERLLCTNNESLSLVIEFNDCTFNLYRNTLALYYGSGITFNNCKFIFNDKNTSEERIVLNQSGYGHVRCPWFFNNCYFESKYPIEIHNSKNVIDCEFNGDIKLSDFEEW